jgi:peptidoglycan-associated lipoprotein
MAAALGIGLTASGCASVKPEELDDRLAAMRQEIQAELDASASRITATNNRVGTLEGRVGTLERDLAGLMVEFETTVEAMDDALRFSTPVHFAYDSSEIRAVDTAFLDRFASVVRSHYPGATITVEGFTDPAGSAEYNLALSQRRAEAVMAYLAGGGGLAADRLRAIGYGEEPARQVVPGAWGTGGRGVENRRVALVVDYLPRPDAMSPATD